MHSVSSKQTLILIFATAVFKKKRSKWSFHDQNSFSTNYAHIAENFVKTSLIETLDRGEAVLRKH